MSSETGPTSPDGFWDRATLPGRVLGALDDAGERWAEPLRGRRWADLGAAVLSNLSDHGVVWVLAAAWMARRKSPRRRRAVVALAIAGIASYGVNRAMKQVAERSRPERPSPPGEGLPVRPPSSSSFPSGHTLASFCTALAMPATPTMRRVALVFAAAVAASRVHLRAHHSSDVLGGALVGAALGTLVRPLVDVVSSPRDVGRDRAE